MWIPIRALLLTFVVASLACTPSAPAPTPTASSSTQPEVDSAQTALADSDHATEAAEPTENEITGRVVRVLDGDTFEFLLEDDSIKRIRLYGIDAPEPGQPFWKTSKVLLSGLLKNGALRAVEVDTDAYGRMIANVYAGDVSVSLELVESGLAWHYSRYAPDDEELELAQADAKEAKRGLWSEDKATAPWDWRYLSKEERDKLR
ncbi:MAG: thermonuclease family protein [Pirellulaceae bacterium]